MTKFTAAATAPMQFTCVVLNGATFEGPVVSFLPLFSIAPVSTFCFSILGTSGSEHRSTFQEKETKNIADLCKIQLVLQQKYLKS